MELIGRVQIGPSGKLLCLLNTKTIITAPNSKRPLLQAEKGSEDSRCPNTPTGPVRVPSI